MEYKITFTDGSEAYLAHSGVKGMKWGVWNEETRARRSAARAARKEAQKYTGPDSKGKRFAKNMAKYQTQLDIPLAVGKGLGAGVVSGNPVTGLAVGGVAYGMFTTMSLADCGVAIARGKKTYWDKVDDKAKTAAKKK